jgi:hypothetical protein
MRKVENEAETMNINQVAEFKSCLTCVYRKPYPASMQTGEPVFYRFLCGLSLDSQKELVRPEEVCHHWKGVTPGID